MRKPPFLQSVVMCYMHHPVFAVNFLLRFIKLIQKVFLVYLLMHMSAHLSYAHQSPLSIISSLFCWHKTSLPQVLPIADYIHILPRFTSQITGLCFKLVTFLFLFFVILFWLEFSLVLCSGESRLWMHLKFFPCHSCFTRFTGIVYSHNTTTAVVRRRNLQCMGWRLV